VHAHRKSLDQRFHVPEHQMKRREPQAEANLKVARKTNLEFIESCRLGIMMKTTIKHGGPGAPPAGRPPASAASFSVLNGPGPVNSAAAGPVAHDAPQLVAQ
jgi:hypothetical protein